MSTHNIGFYGELEKIIPELSLNTPPYQVGQSPADLTLTFHPTCLLRTLETLCKDCQSLFSG